MVLVSWLAFQYGYLQAGFDNVALRTQVYELRQQLYTEEQRFSHLREDYSVLDRSVEVDKEAYNRIDKSIRDLQDEILELKEEVTFYRGIVAPKETASGLEVTSLHFNSLTTVGGYRFKLVLSQLKQNPHALSGIGQLSIEGIQNGTQKTLDLSDLTGGKLKEIKLRFKYFQNFEGDVIFPAGFTPSGVTVELRTDGRQGVSLKKIFNWTDSTG